MDKTIFNPLARSVFCGFCHNKNILSTRRSIRTALVAPAYLICLQSVGHSANVLLNSGFENTQINTIPYNTQRALPGNPNGWAESHDNGNIRTYLQGTVGLEWQTTSTDSKIELWRNGNVGATTTGAVLAPEGQQFAEINATQDASLFQDVTIDLSGLVDLSFYHRGRNGTDTLRVTVTYLGTDNAIGGGDDVVEFTDTYATGNAAWILYQENDEFTSVAGGKYRFAYTSVSTSSNKPAEGNFIDDPRFGIDSIPEPSAALIGGLGILTLLRRRR